MRVAPQTKLQDKPTQMSRMMSLPSQKRPNLTPIAAAKGELRQVPGPDCWAPSQNTRDHDAPWYCFSPCATRKGPSLYPEYRPPKERWNNSSWAYWASDLGKQLHRGCVMAKSRTLVVYGVRRARVSFEAAREAEDQAFETSERSHVEWNGINSDGNPG